MTVDVTKDKVDAVIKAVRDLAKKQVLVGVPASTDNRSDGSRIGNAAIGYINEFGAPAVNIPPRPHLVPGVRAALKPIMDQLRQAAKVAIDGDAGKVNAALERAGLVAESSVKNTIQKSIPPPLKPGSIRARWGRQESRKGQPVPNNFAQSAIPLISTGGYLKSITYVVRKAKGNAQP